MKKYKGILIFIIILLILIIAYALIPRVWVLQYKTVALQINNTVYTLDEDDAKQVKQILNGEIYSPDIIACDFSINTYIVFDNEKKISLARGCYDAFLDLSNNKYFGIYESEGKKLESILKKYIAMYETKI